MVPAWRSAGVGQEEQLQLTPKAPPARRPSESEVESEAQGEVRNTKLGTGSVSLSSIRKVTPKPKVLLALQAKRRVYCSKQRP